MISSFTAISPQPDEPKTKRPVADSTSSEWSVRNPAPFTACAEIATIT